MRHQVVTPNIEMDWPLSRKDIARLNAENYCKPLFSDDNGDWFVMGRPELRPFAGSARARLRLRRCATGSLEGCGEMGRLQAHVNALRDILSNGQP